MLEKLPDVVGHVLRGQRAGLGKTAFQAVDLRAGMAALTVSSLAFVDHAPIPEVGWPAMTMGFKASPAIAKSVKVGDKVAFDLKVQGGAGEITAIRKQ